MTRRTRYPEEVRERAVRLVLEHAGEYASQSFTRLYSLTQTNESMRAPLAL